MGASRLPVPHVRRDLNRWLPLVKWFLAILIDVLIVRMVIAPAVVTLLGDRAWWLPETLDRVLPNVSLEGHRPEEIEAEEERERVLVGAP